MSPGTWIRHAGLAGLLVLLGQVVPGQTQGHKGKSYALLIGVRDYEKRSTLGPLRFTENDVEELAKILARPGSPFRGNVRLLTCSRGRKDPRDEPTARNIRSAVAALIKGKGNDDTVLVALTGHGVQLAVRDPKGNETDRSYAYFCPNDADLAGADFETGRHKRLVLLSDLLGDLGECGAGAKLVLMDACRNEVRARSLRLNKGLVPEGVAALFSCKTGQVAFETDKLGKGHGVFFYFVLEGLKGAAKDRKGQVTWNSLAEYVTDKVDEEVALLVGGGVRQTPHEIRSLAGKPPLLLPAAGEAVKKPQDEAVGKPKAVQKEVTSSVGMKLARVPAGKFAMGSPAAEEDRDDDEKQHEVEITRPFYLGVHEVTQEQFEEVMGYNPSYFSAGGKAKDGVTYVRPPAGGKAQVKGMNTARFPAENVSWDEAVAFCEKLSERAVEKRAGRKYRLPTEAEWEYACRAGAKEHQVFHYGHSLSSGLANFNGNNPYGAADKGPNLQRTCPVGSYRPNAFGLFDMHGNVGEWCADWYGEDYYAGGQRRDPRGPATGTLRVTRGGSWYSIGEYCRSAFRARLAPGKPGNLQGFRVALLARPD